MHHDIFPIVRTVVEYGKDTKKELYKDDHLKCWYCGKEFKLKENHVVWDKYDRELITCPRCRVRTDAFYYFDNILNEREGKPKPKIGKSRKVPTVVKRLA